MGIRSTVASILSSPLATLLETRVRELVDEALAGRDFAEPAAIRELAGHLDHARTALTELQAEIETLKAGMVALDEASGDDDSGETTLRVAAAETKLASATERAAALDAELRRLADEVISTRESLSDAESRVASVTDAAEGAKSLADQATTRLGKLGEAPAKKPAKTDPADRGCLLDGCDGKHRARGFCGKHYMMWTRGTLPGFVLGDGTAFFEEDGPVFKVGTKHKGKAVKLEGGKAVLA